MAFNAGEIEAVLKLRDEMSGKLREASGVLSKFGDNAGKTAANLAAFGSSATSAGMALSAGITAPILAAAGASVYFSGQFESTMVKLHTLAGVASEDLTKVKNHILELAPAVGIGPQALALAMTKISSTVSDTTVALEILDISARGSAAGLGEAVDVAGALTSVINSYGSANITAARAGDILTQAIKDGGAEAKELAPTLANVVPFAAAMGVSFEEVAANLATMTKLGVPATEAVTSLTSVMAALVNPTEEGRDALKRFTKDIKEGGMSFDDLRKKVGKEGLASTMIFLKERFGDNTEELIKLFGRVEGFKNLLGTAASQAETYTQVLKNMAESSKGAGVLQEAFNEITKTTEHSLKILSSQVGVIAIRFGDALAPTLAKVVVAAEPILDTVIKLVEWFGKLDPPIQKTIIGAFGLAAAVGPVLLVLGQFAAGLAAVITIAPAVGVAIGVITWPVGLLVIAVGAAIAILIKLKSNLDNLGTATDDAAKKVEFLDTKQQQQWESQQKVTEKVLEATVATKNLTEVTDGMTVQMTVLSGKLSEAASATESNSDKQKQQTIITKEAQAAIDDHQKAVSKLTGELKGNAEGTKVIQDAFIALTKSGKELSGELSARLIPKFDELREAGKTLTQSQNDVYAAGVKHKDGLIAQGVAVLKNTDVTLQMIEAQKLLGHTEEEISQQFHVTKEVLKAYSVGLKRASDDQADLAKSTLEADLAIAASGEATFASRLNVIALNRAAEIAADAERISGASKAASIIAKYSADTYKELQALRVADSSAQSVQGLSDQAAKLKIIQDGLNQELTAIRASNNLSHAAAKELTNLLIREAERKKQAVLGIEKTLQDNSIAHLRELANTAAATYAKMAAAPLNTYLPATLRAYKMAADASALASKGQILNIAELEKASGDDLRKIADTAKTAYSYATSHSDDFSRKAIDNLKRVAEQTEKNTKKTLSFGEALGSLSGLFVSLGQIAGGSLGEIFSALGATTAMLKASSEAAEESGGQFGFMSQALDENADSATRVKSGVMAIGAVAQGVSAVLKATSSHATAAGNAMAGAMAGMQAGAAFGPIGMAIGAAAGFLVGLIKGKPEWAKAASEIANDFGAKISDQLAKTIADSAKHNFGGNLRIASVFAAGSIFPKVDAENFNRALSITNEALTMVAKNQLTVAQGGQVVNDMFTKMQKAGTDATGLIAKGLVEIIALDFQIGTRSASVAAFVTTETTKAIDGLTKYINYAASAFDAQNAKTKEAQRISQEGSKALSGAILGAFVELQKQGMSVTAALKAVEPAVQGLSKLLEATGISGGAAFDRIVAMATLANDAIAGPAIDAVTGLNQAMISLHNAGILDSEMFLGLAGEVTATFNKLVKGGAEGKTALTLMQPSLQTIWQLQKDFGYAVDEATQDLINQGLQAGIVGGQHESVERQILGVLNKIAAIFAGEIPAGLEKTRKAAEETVNVLQEKLNSLRAPDITMDYDFNDDLMLPRQYYNLSRGEQGGLVTQNGIQFLGHGGMIRRYASGTDTVPALLTPGESVLTTDATRSLGATAISRLNAGGSLSNDAVIYELKLLRKQQAASDRQLPLLVALSVRDAIQLNR